MSEPSPEEIIPAEEEVEKEEELAEAPEGKSEYEQYVSRGGIINEKDYRSALDRAGDTSTLDRARITQAEIIARVAGITLENPEGSLDPRVALYGILRGDTNPGARYHHSQMSDQRLFAEALRMLGDTESLRKLIASHPNISFE